MKCTIFAKMPGSTGIKLIYFNCNVQKYKYFICIDYSIYSTWKKSTKNIQFVRNYNMKSSKCICLWWSLGRSKVINELLERKSYIVHYRCWPPLVVLGFNGRFLDSFHVACTKSL